MRLDQAAVTIELEYAAPFDWDSIIEFLAARAIPDVEVVGPRRYRRAVDLEGKRGTIDVAPATANDALTLTVRFPDPRALPSIVGRVRRLFDLDTDTGPVEAHLAADPTLAPLVRGRPGLRVPGAWDGFELAVRAILGQQITVTGARRLIGQLVAEHGERLRDDEVVQGSDGEWPTAVFPTPERIARSDLSGLGMPRARLVALSELGAATAADPGLFGPYRSLEEAVARLTALPGIGPWTAQYIAMRALREADAFPAADIGLLRALTGADGRRPTPTAILARAEAWRPWRAYAAQHLWTSLVLGDTRATGRRRRQSRRENRALPDTARDVRMPTS